MNLRGLQRMISTSSSTERLYKNIFFTIFSKCFLIICSMKLMRLLFFLLVISLVLQNTCPFGFASKTAFTAPHMHDCPLRKSHHSPAKGQNSVDDNTGRLLYPSFMFSVPDTQSVVFRFQMNTEYTVLYSDNYKDHFKEPSTRPPVA
jgi:hypothetical protein